MTFLLHFGLHMKFHVGKFYIAYVTECDDFIVILNLLIIQHINFLIFLLDY